MAGGNVVISSGNPTGLATSTVSGTVGPPVSTLASPPVLPPPLSAANYAAAQGRAAYQGLTGHTELSSEQIALLSGALTEKKHSSPIGWIIGIIAALLLGALVIGLIVYFTRKSGDDDNNMGTGIPLKDGMVVRIRSTTDQCLTSVGKNPGDSVAMMACTKTMGNNQKWIARRVAGSGWAFESMAAPGQCAVITSNMPPKIDSCQINSKRGSCAMPGAINYCVDGAPIPNSGTPPKTYTAADCSQKVGSQQLFCDLVWVPYGQTGNDPIILGKNYVWYNANQAAWTSTEVPNCIGVNAATGSLATSKGFCTGNSVLKLRVEAADVPL